MPFLNGNWNLIFPSFISIIAPIALRKGLPRIIGHVGLQSISRTRKIYGHIIPICNNKNIINSSHRFPNSGIRKMQI